MSFTPSEMPNGSSIRKLSLYPELTVAENIFMGHAPDRRFGFLRVMDWETIFRRAQEILAELDVHDLDVRRKVGTLNVSNRQRVEIAKALSLNAKLLIMDEPTAALTEADVEQLFRITRLLRSRGVGIIYISHKLSEVFALADRVTVLRDGQYIGSKAVTDTSERELISMMVGRTIDELFPKQEARVGKVVLEHDILSETEVEDPLVAAQVNPEHKKPSVETFLHVFCLSHEGVTWVGHTHAVAVNKILCSALGAEPFKRHIFTFRRSPGRNSRGCRS